MVTVVRKKEYQALLHVKAECKRLKEALPFLTCAVKGILRATTDILSDPTSDDAAAAKESISELCEMLEDQVDSFAEDEEWEAYQSAAPQQPKRQVPALTEEAAADMRQQLEMALADLDIMRVALQGSEQRTAELVAELQKTCVNESRLRRQYLESIEKIEQERQEDRKKEEKARAAAMDRTFAAKLYDVNRLGTIISTQTHEINDLRKKLEFAGSDCPWHREVVTKLAANLAESQRLTAEQAAEIATLQEHLAESQRLTAKQAAQIATLQQEAAAAAKAKRKAHNREVILSEAGIVQAQQIAKLSEDAAAAEQLNKQLMQKNTKQQEILDRLMSAGCAAPEPATPAQLRVSSSPSIFKKFSCSG